MRAYTDALERALGAIVAKAHGELTLLKERSAAVVAESAARIAEAEARLQSIEARIDVRLLAVRDGRDGADGAPGHDGLDGAAGRDGLEGAAGRDGLDGAAGRDGLDGASGRDGLDGAAGRDGLDGAAGRDGLDGAPGVPGRDGLDGVAGRAGLDGAPGRDGADGARGLEGAPGKLPIVRTWSDEVHYEGDVVCHAGSTWQALKDTGHQPPHGDWGLIASAGRDGADGRSFVVRGTWAADGAYLAMDVVALGGSSFVARQDDPGACPGAGWQLLSSRGARGQQGEKGERGERGPGGKAGSPVVGVAIDGEGLLTVTNADGSRVECDLYPVLSRLA